jgi:peptidoglycan lytic transglycosylase
MKAVTPNSPARLTSRCVAGLLSLLLVVPLLAARSGNDSTAQSSHPATRSTKKATKRKPSAAARSDHRAGTRTEARSRVRRRHRYSRPERIARTTRIRRAFVASTELRPMAQQLATMRTPAAYEGVTEYAHHHTGEAAAAAYLALGHAYLLDRRYHDAEISFREALDHGQELADYADFLDAQASHDAGDDAVAETLLHGFDERYPDSVFDEQAPVLEANVLLALNNPAGAQEALDKAAELGNAGHASFELAEGQVAYTLGRKQAAEEFFKHVLLGYPLSSEAQIARARLTEMGAESSLTLGELRSLGDAYYNAGRYNSAAEQYRALMRSPELSSAERDTFTVAEAACELKLHRLTRAEAEALPDTDDENGARRLYLLMELARDRNDTDSQQSIVTVMERRFPQSPWLAEALFSSGNMYLLRRDYSTAIDYYSYLAAHFPENTDAAAAHWRAGWLSYRLGHYQEAAHLFDEQIKLYPDADQTVSALYWRGRLFETLDHYPSLAATNYKAIVRAYPHYFYAQLARLRLAALGKTLPAAEPALDHFQPMAEPHLVDAFPADSPHLAKARLLANAGLNEYIAAEIQADPDSSSWSTLAEAQIFASYGETYRALRVMKRGLPREAMAPIASIPLVYWRILFPEPWWDTIKAESAKNNLDPYLVLSLIRQESEFNPSVISYADAYGLMQLLPSVGRAMARQEGMRDFHTFQLLDPETNIRLGTRYLREMLDKFGGVQEYALAAYNAGDYRVADWEAAGPYTGMDEFVESIPFTQTRDYVEAILRNEETYRAIDEYTQGQARSERAEAQ